MYWLVFRYHFVTIPLMSSSSSRIRLLFLMCNACNCNRLSLAPIAHRVATNNCQRLLICYRFVSARINNDNAINVRRQRTMKAVTEQGRVAMINERNYHFLDSANKIDNFYRTIRMRFNSLLVVKNQFKWKWDLTFSSRFPYQKANSRVKYKCDGVTGLSSYDMVMKNCHFFTVPSGVSHITPIFMYVL